MSDEQQPETPTAPIAVTIEHVIQLFARVDGDIPKAVALLNSPEFLAGAKLSHLEPIRERIVADLGFTKRVVDVLLSIFPAPVPPPAQ